MKRKSARKKNTFSIDAKAKRIKELLYTQKIKKIRNAMKKQKDEQVNKYHKQKLYRPEPVLKKEIINSTTD